MKLPFAVRLALGALARFGRRPVPPRIFISPF